MSICVIVMGGDTASRLDSTIDVAATVTGAGGAVMAGCAKCIQTQRVVIAQPETSSSPYTVSALNSAELKPAETYVLSFPLRSNAESWLNAQAQKLVGKTVYIIDSTIVDPVVEIQ